jgi:capsular exopolysaccharide synthesis family protein
MALQAWIDAVRRHLVAVVVVLLVATAGALGLSLATTPLYKSSASLFFSLQYGNTANDLAQGSTFTQDQMASYATLVTTPVVLDPVVESLDLPGSADDLARRVTATAPDNQVVLTITVSDTSPDRAAGIASAVADQLTQTVERVAPKNAEGKSTVEVSLVEPATVPRFQSAPNTRLNVVLGLFLGLVVAGAYVAGREVLDTRVRDAARLTALTDAPLLGSVPTHAGSATGVAMTDEPLGAQAEVFRQVATNVEFLRRDGEALQLVVSSSLPGEGKSTLALNLALALAEAGHRVLLVDADLRRPSIADKLDLAGAAGLSTVLIGRATLPDVVQEVGVHGLHVLASGAVPPNPSQLLASSGVTDLFAEAARTYDVVVVDSPPILPVSDALLLSRFVTGTVLVTGSRRTRRNQLAETLRRMSTVEAPLLGVVLNQVAPREQPYGYGGYGSLEPVAAPERNRRRWFGRRRSRPAASAPRAAMVASRLPLPPVPGRVRPRDAGA